MKFVLILLVLSVYITTIRPFLLKDLWQRLLKINQNNTNSRLVGSFDKNVHIENKPYARSLKSVDNELQYDLENSISIESVKHDRRNARRRMNYFRITPHPYPRRRDNVEVWNQLLESLKMDKKLISRQKKPNDFGNNRLKILSDNEKITLPKKATVLKKISPPKKPTVLNRNKTEKPVVKEKKSLRRADDTTEDDESSERDYGMEYWQDLVRKERQFLKEQALEASTPMGDVVNMAAARPWGVPCGDPNQHDMPWGTCMLPMECEPEYRVYRGDTACGKTQFVCCALQLNTYDLYAGGDLSFADTDLEPGSSDEPKKSSEKKKEKEQKIKRERERKRNKRKKNIKRNIRRIVKQINNILSKMYKNMTTQRKLKTKNLKAYIKMLKKKYKKDRKDVKDLHVDLLEGIDNNLLARLEELAVVNKEFANNDTFREILVNHTISAKAAKMLTEMYPDLEPSLRSYSRRTGANLKDGDSSYDVEYGFLYY